MTEQEKPRILLNGSFAESLILFRGPLIAAMSARGYQVHVTAPAISAEIEHQLLALGAIVHDVPLARTGINPFHDYKYAKAIVKLIKIIRPIRVINYTIKPNIWGSIAARFCQTKAASIVTGLGLAFIPSTKMKIRIIQFAMRRLYAIATSGNDVVVFQNPDDINDFCNAGCLIDRRKAVLINGSGVDIGHYAVAPLPEQPVFLMMARLLGSKGVREYAAAAKCITSERSGCRFMLAGYFDGGPDGISPDELREWEAEGLEYVGMLSDVRPTIRAASIYVLPSYREGTPRSVLEAMAMGRPIITTDVPGCRETVVDGVNGFLVAPRNSADLARAMRILACDNGLRTRMGIRSLQLAKEKYAVDNVNFALLNHLSL